MRLLPWIMAARPRTLTLSITPVVVGTALAWAVERKAHWPAVAAALVGAMCIQLGTNLHNDMADSQRGGDGPDRIGPPRVTASGLLSAESVNRGAIACFGLGAVGGTYWLCTGALTAAAVEAGLAVGSITGAVLLVNNHRDAAADARAGRRTLAIVAGPNVTIAIYAVLMLLPFALLPLIGDALPSGHAWPAWIALLPALAVMYRFAVEPRGPIFNRILVQTVQVQLLFSLLLSLGL